MIYNFLILVGKVCYKIFAKVTVIGKQNIPKKGSVLIVSNHTANLDPAILAVMLPRTINFVGKTELFKYKITSFLMKALHVIPIRRFYLDRKGLVRIFEAIEQGKAIGFFPEGTRSGSSGLKKGNQGAAYIASKSGVSVIPVGITGTSKINSYLRFPFPFSKIVVNIGEEIQIDENCDLETGTNIIMNKIAELLPESLRGAYKG
ncbi:MAG: 1-acyl-sn-glycerol-3-phosphate acyltransferase [SAR202 cluster bacterium]|nr:1-acyl-sn-glycerol-3-phosphate acyltransferase [Chloroflexota bacterium]MQG50982.1 1-acyl-sn-glycerol-3-phosphate acyltransferase [SAR202 cluster bacterium]|tara:strand:+ start:2113 stop:2724 length:612 start_codon:yes stop_codon:yes gene_type:complete